MEGQNKTDSKTTKSSSSSEKKIAPGTGTCPYCKNGNIIKTKRANVALVGVGLLGLLLTFWTIIGCGFIILIIVGAIGNRVQACSACGYKA